MARSGLKKGITVLVATFAATAPANAFDASVSIFARAPTICRVNMVSAAAPLHVQTGTNDLGTLVELCNNVGGYTVTLHHPAGLTDAWVEVGNSRIPISRTETHTVIVDADEPAYRERPIHLVLDQVPDGEVALGLDAQAKGLIY